MAQVAPSSRPTPVGPKPTPVTPGGGGPVTGPGGGGGSPTPSPSGSPTGSPGPSPSATPPPTSLPLSITINSVASGRAYVVDVIDVGKEIYIDTTTKVAAIDPILRAHQFIKSANADAGATNAPFLTFTVNQAVTVDVMTSGATPPWLPAQSFAAIPTTTFDTDEPRSYNHRTKAFTTCRIDLNGMGDPTGRMYVTIVRNYVTFQPCT